MHIKAKLEALIYAAEDPITLDQMAALLREDLLALRTAPEPEPQTEQAENPRQQQKQPLSLPSRNARTAR